MHSPVGEVETFRRNATAVTLCSSTGGNALEHTEGKIKSGPRELVRKVDVAFVQGLNKGIAGSWAEKRRKGVPGRGTQRSVLGCWCGSRDTLLAQPWPAGCLCPMTGDPGLTSEDRARDRMQLSPPPPVLRRLFSSNTVKWLYELRVGLGGYFPNLKPGLGSDSGLECLKLGL